MKAVILAGGLGTRISEVDFQSIQHKARMIRWQGKLKKNFLSLFEKKQTLDIAGTKDAPIRDVYEAAQVIHDALQRLAKGE